MLTVFTMALCTMIAFVLVFVRCFGWAPLLKYSDIIDVVFTVVVGLMFMGTLTGMLVAVMAGLFLSVFFTLVKAATGIHGNGRFHWVVKLYRNRKVPQHCSADEYDANGQWVYNTEAYK